MGKNGIPDRWLPYSPMGSIIPGTRFIACKVPLKDALLRTLPENERFGPKELLEAFPKIGLLVDLTNTTRYYFKQDFTDKNVRYEKIFCPGKVVPPNSTIKQFYNVVSDYLATETDPDAVIVVHCTHGVNRTGYFICRYMIERLNMSPEEAVKNFQTARGHEIERETYVSDLKNGCKGGNESDLRFVPSFGRDGRRDGRRQMNNSKRDFRGANRYDELPEKRYRNDYNQTNDTNRHRQWSDSKQRHKGFNNFDRNQTTSDDSKFSYNWRDQERNRPSYQSTTPLPQFTPAHRQANQQGNSLPRYQHPEPPHHRRPYDDARYPKRGSFTGPPPIRGIFKEPPHKGFSPLPKFSHPEPTMEAAPSSRLAEISISNPHNSYYSPAGHQNPSSGHRGHFRGRISSRGRGNDRGRGSFYQGESSGRSRGRGPQRNNFSR